VNLLIHSVAYIVICPHHLGNTTHLSYNCCYRDSHSSRLRSNSQSLILSVKHHVLASEHDIAINLQIAACIALNSSIASLAVHLSKRDLSTRNDSHVASADSHAKIGRRDAAWVDIATDSVVELSTLNLRVISVGHLWVNQDKRSSSI
jgi:hypothetical protein